MKKNIYKNLENYNRSSSFKYEQFIAGTVLFLATNIVLMAVHFSTVPLVFFMTLWLVTLYIALYSFIYDVGPSLLQSISKGRLNFYTTYRKVKKFEKSAVKEFGSIKVLRDIVWHLQNNGKKPTDKNIYAKFDRYKKSNLTRKRISRLKGIDSGKKRSVAKGALSLLDDTLCISLADILRSYSGVLYATAFFSALLFVPSLPLKTTGAFALGLLAGYWIIFFLLVKNKKITKKQIKNRRKYIKSLEKSELLDGFARSEIAFLKANKMFDPKNIQRLIKGREKLSGVIYFSMGEIK